MHEITATRARFDVLIDAFAAAQYVVDAKPKPIVLQLGRTMPALDRILDGRAWALVTAHNPDGRRQSPGRNALAHKALTACLDRIAPVMRLPTSNRDPAGHWPDEPGWLFTPEDIMQADGLAQRFGQRAIVTGGAGQCTELRIYDAGSAALPEFARNVRT